MDKFIVFDNEGETLDRYTIIESKTGDMLGLCSTGLSFNMFCGNIVDNEMFHTYGASWRRHLDSKRVIKSRLPVLVERLRAEGLSGKVIPFDSLDSNLQTLIIKRFES